MLVVMLVYGVKTEREQLVLVVMLVYGVKKCERTATVSRHVGVRCENSEREWLLLVVMFVHSVKIV